MNNDKKELGYLQQIDKWLDEKIYQIRETGAGLPDDTITTVKREIKEKVLESYRNGLRDAGKSVKPKSYQKTRK